MCLPFIFSRSPTQTMGKKNKPFASTISIFIATYILICICCCCCLHRSFPLHLFIRFHMCDFFLSDTEQLTHNGFYGFCHTIGNLWDRIFFYVMRFDSRQFQCRHGFIRVQIQIICTHGLLTYIYIKKNTVNDKNDGFCVDGLQFVGLFPKWFQIPCHLKIFELNHMMTCVWTILPKTHQKIDLRKQMNLWVSVQLSPFYDMHITLAYLDHFELRQIFKWINNSFVRISICAPYVASNLGTVGKLADDFYFHFMCVVYAHVYACMTTESFTTNNKYI